jgi:toxin ParE1/3/4
LRAWLLTGFPYLAFYVGRGSEIDVWRILHIRRDIGSALADEEE